VLETLDFPLEKPWIFPWKNLGRSLGKTLDFGLGKTLELSLGKTLDFPLVKP